MQKIRCLLVDDEPLAIVLLKQHIAQVDLLEVVGECPNAIKALEEMRVKDVDLLFLDIRMPSVSGLELLKMLRHPPKVIITTAYREYALDGYDLDLVDYLLKPITFDRFLKAIQRLLRQIDAPATQPKPPATQPRPPAAQANPAAPVDPPPLYIKSGYRNLRVPADSILYIESLKDYVRIHTATGPVTTKYKISEMETDLGSSQFLRIHRSFIVNLRHITAYTSSHIEIGATQLPIGESYKEYALKTIRNAGC